MAALGAINLRSLPQDFKIDRARMARSLPRQSKVGRTRMAIDRTGTRRSLEVGKQTVREKLDGFKLQERERLLNAEAESVIAAVSRENVATREMIQQLAEYTEEMQREERDLPSIDELLEKIEQQRATASKAFMDSIGRVNPEIREAVLRDVKEYKRASERERVLKMLRAALKHLSSLLQSLILWCCFWISSENSSQRRRVRRTM